LHERADHYGYLHPPYTLLNPGQFVKDGGDVLRILFLLNPECAMH